jgi:N-acetylglucosamine-6-phosphate deacetylase
MDRAVQNMVQLGSVSVQDAVRMASSTPARIMGVADCKGSLEAGKDADLVILDAGLEVTMTMIAGSMVHDLLPVPPLP